MDFSVFIFVFPFVYVALLPLYCYAHFYLVFHKLPPQLFLKADTLLSLLSVYYASLNLTSLLPAIMLF